MENKMLSAVLVDARPVAVAGEDLTVAFASSAAFLKKKAEHPDNRAIVSDALRQLSGGRWRRPMNCSRSCPRRGAASSRAPRRRSGWRASWRSSTPRSSRRGRGDGEQQ